MTVLTDAYAKARIEGQMAEDEAKITVTHMKVDQLREEWVSLMGMVAYYSKLERLLYANPRSQFDKAREYLELIEKNPDNRDAIEGLIHLVSQMVDYESGDPAYSG